ncbi:MAG: hypothetical protein ABSB35_31135 [Bryobacteraceae bacterium]|jgi:hypothetical protein
MPTCDEITRAVGKYNSENSTYDHALGSALDPVQSSAPSLGRFLAEVCLIADWGSIPLTYFRFRDRVAMAEEIETSWPLLQSMRSWHAENWDTETKMLTKAVGLLPDTQLLPTPGAKRQLSFLSKYLHRCVNEAFPIWDKNARTALHNDNDETSWLSYSKWVVCVRQEAATHRTCCLEQLRLPGECLLRTLDKALFTLGGEILNEKVGRKT